MNQETFVSLLIDWYNQNKRQMPWRETKNPYYIWISEIMLQQTQVATVIPYYLKFTTRFPTIKDLAEATLEEVHQYWQGLGYYRRGENLWKGAKLICERWQGYFPRKVEEIKEIPGIGPYTLGAVCSIAFNIPLPAVDGNVMRVISRLYCLSEDIAIPKNRKIFEETVQELIPEESLVGTFNQALMELGALICTPKSPNCTCCPVRTLCQAYQTKAVDHYPVKTKKPNKIIEQYYVLLIYKEDQLGFIKRPKEGLLANLWGLPMIEEAKWTSKFDHYILSSCFSQGYSLQFDKVTHTFTHKKWVMTPIAINWSKELESMLQAVSIDPSQITYYNEEIMQKIPIATAFKKVVKVHKNIS